MKLGKVLKGLILEVASIESIIDAIKNKKIVSIYYEGDEGDGFTGRGLRTIEPVCLGTSKADNKVLRAWDLEGASYTGSKGEQPLPSWRLFRVDKIASFNPTGENFTEMKPGYNQNGDKSMKSVIINAKF